MSQAKKWQKKKTEKSACEKNVRNNKEILRHQKANKK